MIAVYSIDNILDMISIFLLDENNSAFTPVCRRPGIFHAAGAGFSYQAVKGPADLI